MRVALALTLNRNQCMSRTSPFGSVQSELAETLPAERRSLPDDLKPPDFVLAKIGHPELAFVANFDELMRVGA